MVGNNPECFASAIVGVDVCGRFDTRGSKFLIAYGYSHVKSKRPFDSTQFERHGRCRRLQKVQ